MQHSQPGGGNQAYQKQAEQHSPLAATIPPETTVR